MKRVVLRSVQIGALLILAGTIPFLLQIRKANKTFDLEKKTFQEKSTVPLEIKEFRYAPDPQLKLVTGPLEARDAAIFKDLIYAATPTGLVTFNAEGKKLQHFSASDGLPASDLTALAVQDEYLWIGTRNAGLLRFDGNAWLHFLPTNPRFRTIHSLLSTPQGELYAGTDHGLLSIQNDRFRPLFPDRLGSLSITSLAGDSRELYIGTFQDGLYRSQGGGLQHFGKEEGLADLLITGLNRVAKGCYVATPSGIQLLSENQFQTVTKNLFASSLILESSTLYAGTQDRGIVEMPLAGSARNSIRPPHNAGMALVRRAGDSVLSLEQNRIRVLSENKRWEDWIPNSGTLTDSNISAILRTDNGELWIGSFDQGIDILSPDMQLIQHLKDDVLFCINHFSQDSKGRIYVSTANGLVVFQPDRSRRVYREKDGLLSDRIMQTLPLDPEGNKVAIATTQGFTLMEGGVMKSLFAFHGLINNHVYAMAAAGNQIFLGTLGGLSSISNLQVVGNWSRQSSGLKRNWINALSVSQDRLYIGTYGSGIQARTASGDWVEFPSIPEDLEINPNAFYYDGRYLFCGTLDRGFFVYEPARDSWKHFRQGLPSRNVTGFTADAAFVYVTTDRGLLRISYDKIQKLSALS